MEKKSQKAILFIDEIQEISEIASGAGIEGAIRHIAEKTEYLSFVFSGSNRHLLSKMFFDKSKPLYKLCDRIILGRISIEDYKFHINQLANEKWGEVLSDETLNEIFSLTELHPYRINNLCNRLWTLNDNHTPDKNEVSECWSELAKEEKSEILMELSSLSLGQKKVLTSIASGQNSGLTGKKSLKSLDLTSSSVIEAISVLEQKDYLEKADNNNYRIIDPLLRFILSTPTSNLTV